MANSSSTGLLPKNSMEICQEQEVVLPFLHHPSCTLSISLFLFISEQLRKPKMPEKRLRERPSRRLFYQREQLHTLLPHTNIPETPNQEGPSLSPEPSTPGTQQSSQTLSSLGTHFRTPLDY